MSQTPSALGKFGPKSLGGWGVGDGISPCLARSSLGSHVVGFDVLCFGGWCFGFRLLLFGLRFEARGLMLGVWLLRFGFWALYFGIWVSNFGPWLWVTRVQGLEFKD